MIKNHAYGLPSGSIRALLALGVFGGIWFLLAKQPQLAVPAYLQNLMFVIMGHYFATRHKSKSGHRLVTVDVRSGLEMVNPSPYEPNPLYLPKGTVRALLVLGFVTVACVLTWQRKWMLDGIMSQSGISLILVAGFMLGVLVGQLFKTERRWVEDIRATISLGAAVLLLLMVFGVLHAPETPNKLEAFAIKFHYEDILAALVGFYFGRKS